MFKKNTSGQRFIVFAFDLATNEPITGDAANITAKLVLDGGAATATDDTNPTEIEDGYYAFTATQAETDADEILILPESSTEGVQVIGSPAVIHPLPANLQDLYDLVEDLAGYGFDSYENSLAILAEGIQSTKENTDYPDGYVYFDVASGAAGTDVGVNGTIRNPCSSIADAITIANARNVKRIKFLRGGWHGSGGSFTVASITSGTLTDFTVDLNGCNIAIHNDVVTGRTTFKNGGMYQSVGSQHILARASDRFEHINFYGKVGLDPQNDLLPLFYYCGFFDQITNISESNEEMRAWVGCYHYELSDSRTDLIVNANNISLNFDLPYWNGDLRFQNMTNSASRIRIYGYGRLRIDNSCTAGSIRHTSHVEVVDQSGNPWENGPGKPTVELISDQGATLSKLESMIQEDGYGYGYQWDELALAILAEGIQSTKENTDYPDGYVYFKSGGQSGTVLGVNGTIQNPCGSWADTVTLAKDLGTRRIKFLGTSPAGIDNTIVMGKFENMFGFEVDMNHCTRYLASVDDEGANTNEVTFRNGKFGGTVGATQRFCQCYLEDCKFQGNIEIYSEESTIFTNCRFADTTIKFMESNIVWATWRGCGNWWNSTLHGDQTIIDFNNMGCRLELVDWFGNLSIRNATISNFRFKFFGSGKLTIEDSCTTGFVYHGPGVEVVDENGDPWVNASGKPQVVFIGESYTVKKLESMIQEDGYGYGYQWNELALALSPGGDADLSPILNMLEDIKGEGFYTENNSLVEITDLLSAIGIVVSAISDDSTDILSYLESADIDGKTLKQAVAIVGAVVAGKITTAQQATEIFKGLDGETDRVSISVDEQGNRTNVVYH